MTSPPVQKLVWLFYRNGQETDKRPSRAYLIAQRLAVAEVAYREDRISAKMALERVEEALDGHVAGVSDHDRAYLAKVIPPEWIAYWMDIPF